MSDFQSTELAMVHPETVILYVAPVTNEYWKLFVSLIVISALCLLTTLILYVLIWEKQNCHGWTQFSYLLALFMFDSVFIPALCPGLTSGTDRNRMCFTLSILNQYFFVSAKTWLAIISIDLFSTIRKMKIIAKSHNKNLRRFALYSSVGWTFPLVFVSTGIMMNWKYRKIIPNKTEDEGLWAKFPDYGFLHCRIPNWFVWECFVFGNCIFHFFMFILIAISIFRQRHLTTLVNNSSFVSIPRASPIIMLLKLFIVVGLSWSYIAVQDLLRAGNINTKQSWGWHIFRCIFFLQGAFISVITLTNGRTLRHLLVKFPRFRAVQNLFRPISLVLSNVTQKLRVTKRKESLQSCASQCTTDTNII